MHLILPHPHTGLLGRMPYQSCTAKFQQQLPPCYTCWPILPKPHRTYRQHTRPAKQFKSMGGTPPLGTSWSNSDHQPNTAICAQGRHNLDGNNRQPSLSTTQHAQGCTTPWTQQAKPCWTHKPGPSPAEPSQPSHLPQRQPTQTTSFASSCFADSGFHCPSPNDPVGAVAFLIHMATTVQPALGQGCCEAEQCHWNMPPHGCAEKLAPGSQCTRASPTSTSQQSSGSTTEP